MDIVILDVAMGHTLVVVVDGDLARRDSADFFIVQNSVAATCIVRDSTIHYPLIPLSRSRTSNEIYALRA